jgi:hypothetical protein
VTKNIFDEAGENSQNLETSNRDKNTGQKQRQKNRSKSKIQDKEKFLETEHTNVSLNYHIKFDNTNNACFAVVGLQALLSCGLYLENLVIYF